MADRAPCTVERGGERMRLGLAIGRLHDLPRVAREIVDQIRQAEEDCFDTVWMSHLLLVEGYDGPTIVAAASSVTRRIELATFVPFLTRHPALVAHQAVTIQALSGNRLALCLASNHRVFLEQGLGIEFGDPVALLEEYLPILGTVMRLEPIRRLSSPYRTRVVPDMPPVIPAPVFLPALRRSMVELAGRLADGVITTMAGPRYLEQEVVPVLMAAAEQAGRPTPRVAAHFFVSITNEVDAARRCADALIDDLYAHPMYLRVLRVDGVDRFGDVAIVGDEAVVAKRLEALSRIGVSDMVASIPVVEGDPGAYERTYRFLADRAASTSSVHGTLASH